jgi:hypothetical protein
MQTALKNYGPFGAELKFQQINQTIENFLNLKKMKTNK